jgi:1,4-alpha-glucan branching enzyme
LLLAYMFTRPGKKLLFMGAELAPWTEWNHDVSLDWHLTDDPRRAAFERYIAQLATLYKREPAFWRDDHSWEGFNWIDVADRDNSVVSYVRRSGSEHVVVVLNLTPVPRERYRIGVPERGSYQRLLSTDDAEWGGSDFGRFDGVQAEQSPQHGYDQSVELTLPPLGAVVLAPART